MLGKTFGTLFLLTLAAMTRPAWGQAPEFRHLDGGRISGVFFLDDTLGWTAEDGARTRRTTDGGQSWVYGKTPDSFREELTDVYFVDDQNGWAVANRKHRLRRECERHHLEGA